MVRYKIPFFCALIILAIVCASKSNGQTCPNKCHCKNNYQIVDCRNRGLSEIPSGIPVSVQELRLDHNTLTDIQADAFKGLIHLRVLYLSNCKINKIAPGTFKEPTNITDLYLTSNVLKDFNATSLQGLQNVQMLHLGGNELTAIPDLGRLRALVSFVIDTNELSNASFPEGFGKLLNLTRITLSNNKITRLADGDLKSLRQSKVAKLYLARNQIAQIGKLSLEPIADTLVSLSLGHNPLSSTSLRDGLFGLRQSKQLTSLDIPALSFGGVMNSDTFQYLNSTPLLKLKMYCNSVHQLEPRLFSHVRNADYIDASSCQIRDIEQTVFAGMAKLKELRLNENFLSYVPQNLPNSLRILDLSENQIINFKDFQFAGMRNIETLRLRKSGVERIPTNSFAGLEKIKTLDLSENRISSIGKSVFGMLHKLKTLKLNDNRIGLIQTDIFSSSSALQFLDMSKNYIGRSSIPLDLFKGTSKLKILFLSDNELGYVFKNDPNGMLFKNLYKLENLTLERNRISQLWPAQFQNLTSVKNLSLSDNQVSFFTSQLFAPMTSLRALNLSQNMISLVNSSSIGGLEGRLQTLDLSGSPFACTCDLVWFRRWINQTNITLSQLDVYTCNTPAERRGMPLLQFDPDAIDCVNRWPIYLASAVGGTLALLVVVFISLYRWRWFLKLRYYRFKRLALKRDVPHGYERVEGDDIVSDAFVSFCVDADREWVAVELLARMDSRPPNAGRFNLVCDLNFLPDKSELESVVEAIECTRKAIVVLSDAYIGDPRCVQFELEQIVYESSVERPQRYEMILVLKGLNPNGKIPKVLRQRLERGEFLEWTEDANGQQLFWDQLGEKLEQRPHNINV
ncbi:chondroadherin-like protein [Lingula anatina]|uniref:Chondroadherin-like protein n=1 Tax=Lingula anatina TaxID=7574 RepID=A0A1S3ICW5_LINAN|nr:chondroadherin-like protein [Lingula anatina]XP_013396100.1 chondroadherin-like protein [Lingula anatina]|eukprot:XP_013396099.1 chondroadherin-like protein [Lingula anatina]